MQFLENANAFSVHVTGFKHKIYRWLCFAKMRDLVSGTDQERIQDRAFLSVIGNRDVWCVACLFAKLFFFEFHFVVDRNLIVTSMDQMEIDPLVVEQALLKCFKALWSAEFSVVGRLGDTNKWAFYLRSSIIMCRRWHSARNIWWLCFPA